MLMTQQPQGLMNKKGHCGKLKLSYDGKGKLNLGYNNAQAVGQLGKSSSDTAAQISQFEVLVARAAKRIAARERAAQKFNEKLKKKETKRQAALQQERQEFKSARHKELLGEGPIRFRVEKVSLCERSGSDECFKR